MKKILILCVAVLTLIAVSCERNDVNNDSGDKVQGNKEYTPIELPGLTRAGVQHNNDLAFSCLTQGLHLSDQEKGHVLFSPFSYYSVITMLANADPALFAPTLGISNTPEELEAMREYVSIINKNLPIADYSSEFLSSNSVWYDETKSLDPSFVEKTKSMMNLDTYAVPANPVELTEKIKEWIKSQVGHEHDHLVVTPTFPCLVNVMKFKGAWQEPFDVNKTVKGVFHNSDASKSEVEFMNSSGYMMYVSRDGWEAVELPFGNGNFAMTAVLPPTENPYAKFTSELWTKLEQNLGLAMVYLGIPKFSISSNAIFSNFLTESVRNNIQTEDGEVNVSGLLKDSSFVMRYIIQSVSFEINEESAEVVSASHTDYVGDSGPEYHKYLQFNRPFYFLIREKSTGTIILLGHIKGF